MAEGVRPLAEATSETCYAGVQAEVNVTSMCSTANCKFCIKDIMPLFKEGNVAEFLQRMERAMIEYIKGGGSSVIITGGEPTEAPQKLLGTLEVLRRLDEMYALHHAGDHAFSLVALYTNGTRLHRPVQFNGVAKPILEHLKDLGLRNMNLSVHDYRPGKRRVLEGNDMGKLNVEQAIRDMHNAGMDVRLNCTLVKGNIDSAAEVDKFAQWASAQGVRHIYFRNLFEFDARGHAITPGDQEKLTFTDEHRVDYVQLVEDLRADPTFEERSSVSRNKDTASTTVFKHIPSGVYVAFGDLSIQETKEGDCTIYTIQPDGDVRPDYTAADIDPADQAARLEKLKKAKAARAQKEE